MGMSKRNGGMFYANSITTGTIIVAVGAELPCAAFAVRGGSVLPFRLRHFYFKFPIATARANELGVRPLARIKGYGDAARVSDALFPRLAWPRTLCVCYTDTHILASLPTSLFSLFCDVEN